MCQDNKQAETTQEPSSKKIKKAKKKNKITAKCFTQVESIKLPVQVRPRVGWHDKKRRPHCANLGKYLHTCVCPSSLLIALKF